MNPMALVQAILPLIGGMMSRRGPTQGESRDQNTINELMQSMQGNGQYSDMFNMDYDAYKKSYVDPAMSEFKNVIAPGIQQEYIASGQQRGTGMEDTLSRAGVDMQQNLNKNYADMQNQSMDRKYKGIFGTLGQGQGAPPQGGFGQTAGGFLQSNSANDMMSEIMKLFSSMGGGQ